MKFYNNIPVEKIDIIQKLAYLYWYENVCKDDWTDDKHEDFYKLVKNEVMEYGYEYFENHGN